MINFIIVHSKFESKEKISSRLSKYLTKIQFDNNVIEPEFIDEPASILKINTLTSKPLIILVATGGTEQMVADIIKDTSLPVFLIAPDQKNAVAASLEIYSCFKHKKNIILKYINNAEQLELELNTFVVVAKAIAKINSAVFATIGEPSDWLLTSKNFTEFGNFNTKIISIPTAELLQEVQSIEDKDITIDEFTSTVNNNCSNEIVTNESIIQSGKVYAALNSLKDKYNLSALTIRCFDLLDHKLTACMGLSLLNDNGTVAGCEGDLNATFSMMIASYITGNPCWMANPSSVSFDDNCITFAHCSTPLKMLVPKSIELNTHMESGLSVAVSGKFPKEEVTIFRTGNNFKSMLMAKGKIVTSNMGNANLCRTQAIIQIEGDLNDWLENSLGNHQVIVFGDITNKLKTFCRLSDMDLIEI